MVAEIRTVKSTYETLHIPLSKIHDDPAGAVKAILDFMRISPDMYRVVARPEVSALEVTDTYRKLEDRQREVS